MASTNSSCPRELPRWMRFLVEKLRIADQVAAYPHAVPPRPEPPPPTDPSADPRKA